MVNTFSSPSRGCGGRSPPRSLLPIRATALDSAHAHGSSVQDTQRHHAEVQPPEVFVDLVQPHRLATEHLADENGMASELHLAVVSDLAHLVAIGVFDRCQVRRVGTRGSVVHRAGGTVLQRLVLTSSRSTAVTRSIDMSSSDAGTCCSMLLIHCCACLKVRGGSTCFS